MLRTLITIGANATCAAVALLLVAVVLAVSKPVPVERVFAAFG